MSDPFQEPEASPVPRRRRWPYVIILLSLAVLAVIGLYVYRDVASERELQAALAETDQLDPRWRLDDIEADRAVVADAKNSATPAMATKRLLPKEWPFWQFSSGMTDPQGEGGTGLKAQLEALALSFGKLEPTQQLNEEQVTALRDEMKRAEAALAEARKLVDLTEGRYAITYSPDFIGTLIAHTQNAREIAALLDCDALLRAQDNDPDGALASCRGILNAGRSIGDEPLFISQLVRFAVRAVAVARAQRVLAQGEPSEEALRQFQELLEKEEPEPLLLIAARGERAGDDRLLEAIQTGKINLSMSDLAMGSRDGLTLPESLVQRTGVAKKSQRAAMLRWMNRCVEIAKLPPEKRLGELQQMEATIRDQPLVVRLLMPALSKLAQAAQRSDAQLRCAIVAVAAERYRRAQGHWPETLDALKAADYLRAIPNDPYDGQPLRWRRLDDGVVVYAVGPDGEDNGGKLDRQNPLAPGTDIGFRIWDVAKRRQPPVPFPLEPHLAAVLVGKEAVADDAERIALALFCLQRFKKHYVASFRFFTEAFANDATLADDMLQQHRYNAACAAALAGCGQGNDADKLDDTERERLRRQAVAWLRTDLAYWTEHVDSDRPRVNSTLRWWQQDPDLIGIRDKDAVAKLPADEREACEKLWADVAELLKKASEQKLGRSATAALRFPPQRRARTLAMSVTRDRTGGIFAE
jgi:hypothetical protein